MDQGRASWLGTFERTSFAALAVLFPLFCMWQLHWDLFAPFGGINGDDWTTYHLYARDLVRNGWAMPSVPVPYAFPAGFLYVYLIGGSYILFGEYPNVIHVIQSLMLVVSVILFYKGFTHGVADRTKVVVLWLLAAFAFLDVQRYYVISYMPENLAIFECAVMFYTAARFFYQGKNSALLLLAAAMAALVLTRPMVILAVVGVMAVLVGYRTLARRPSWRMLAAALAVYLLVASFMGARNYASGGQFIFFPRVEAKSMSIPGYGQWVYQTLGNIPSEAMVGPTAVITAILVAARDRPAEVVGDIWRKILFIVGFPNVYDSGMRPRPHWTLMWVAYGAGLFLLRRRWDAYTLFGHVFVLAMAGTLVMLVGLNNYGFRYVLPTIFSAFGGAVPILDRLLTRSARVQPEHV
jgi:hypothetical protein